MDYKMLYSKEIPAKQTLLFPACSPLRRQKEIYL